MREEVEGDGVRVLVRVSLVAREHVARLLLQFGQGGGAGAGDRLVGGGDDAPDGTRLPEGVQHHDERGGRAVGDGEYAGVRVHVIGVDLGDDQRHVGSMRQTPLSSMTTQPRSLAASAISRLMSSFAEMNAMSDSAKTSGAVSSTVSSSPLNSTLFPMERGEAVRRSLSMGKARSSSTAKATLPTAPVAPTMVTLGWATAVSPSPR